MFGICPKSAKLARLYRLEHSLCFVPWRYLLGLDIPKLSVKWLYFLYFFYLNHWAYAWGCSAYHGFVGHEWL